MHLQRIFSLDLKVEWQHLFKTILTLPTIPKGKLGNMLILPDNRFTLIPCCVSRRNRKNSLPLDNFSFSKQQMPTNYLLYLRKGIDINHPVILPQFSKIPGGRWALSEVVEGRVVEIYSWYIVMLLT